PSPASVGEARGLSVSSSDLFSILRADCGDALTDEAREQIENAYFHVECRTRQSLRGGAVFPFEILAAKFGLDEFGRFALLLAFSTVYDRKYEGAYAYLHNSASETRPSRWLAVRLFRLLFGNDAECTALLDGTSPLTRYLCDAGENSRLILRARAASYILGGETPAPRPDGSAARYAITETRIPGRGDTFAAVQDFFTRNAFREDGGCAVMNLYGPEGIGRRYAAACAAAAHGLPLLTVDLDRLILLEERALPARLDEVYLESMLTGAIPAFLYQVRTPGEEEQKFARDSFDARVQFAASAIARRFRFVFWITAERDHSFIATDARQSSIELPMLSAQERGVFWNAWADRSLFSPGLDPDICASQYILTPRDLRRVLKSAADDAAFRGSLITKEILGDAIRRHSRSQLGLYATRINAVYTWDDLVVSDDQKRKMKMICDQVRYRRVVGEEWGFRKKSPYGNGLCALFYGSPGTGKTMAVQVMANELGIDVYRIDLSQLVSKYIGETQKNISELFNRAKNINAMLFFDEADSMFAKRSEVKDSNDRYANADTAFLLQKLEDYDGITILATNYVNNIDDAFKRRIKFMINFVFPTPEVRLTLWRKIIPPSARCDEALDYEFFADNFELSGSNIKEILTNAAFLAAAEGAGIRNCHIIEAIKLNFSKYGKILTDDDFGYLGR
ncbi:MAG: ATP-binding protein, partial [Clostridia bacterium]|nr:ATP-binding protein [Clostridia bacterium]